VARGTRTRLAADAARAAAAPLAAKAALVAGALALVFLLATAQLALFVGVSAVGAPTPCGRMVSINADELPAELIPIYERATRRHRLGARGVPILAAINKIETGFGQNQGPSSAGAAGWMQFMPATWAAYGVDADGDGSKDPADPDDALHAAARYLRASGAPADWHGAIFAYNHAEWYVQQVLAQAEAYAGGIAPVDGGESSCEPADAQGVKKVAGGGEFVPIPGFPGELIDRRLLDDVAYSSAATTSSSPTPTHQPATSPTASTRSASPPTSCPGPTAAGARSTSWLAGPSPRQAGPAPRGGGSATTATPDTVIPSTARHPARPTCTSRGSTPSQQSPGIRRSGSWCSIWTSDRTQRELGHPATWSRPEPSAAQGGRAA
jgi:Transglycosylase SLT domain